MRFSPVDSGHTHDFTRHFIWVLNGQYFMLRICWEKMLHGENVVWIKLPRRARKIMNHWLSTFPRNHLASAYIFPAVYNTSVQCKFFSLRQPHWCEFHCFVARILQFLAVFCLQSSCTFRKIAFRIGATLSHEFLTYIFFARSLRRQVDWPERENSIRYKNTISL